jgi:ABC-type sugar transport system ATPase subunit|tara:strand:+ start:241 stop:1344 length:1104 start_codon:yes stop_codon:yes gene_type:complete
MANIKIEKINKYFDANHVVKDVSLDIKSGSFTVIVGPSGCGKSTILRMIAGLEEINSGSIFIDDAKVNDLPPKDRNIAMVFQSYALYPHMNVYENMAFGLKLEKKNKDEISKRVNESAKILQIEDLLKRKPKQLSGGQRQRVAIGRAITRKPKVFLFDEPLSNLDASLRIQMRVELAKLHNQLKATMVYVTHDQTEAMTMADDIVVLNNGVIYQKGTPLDLYNKPKNIFVAGFIGSPKMNFIQSEVMSIDNKSIEFTLLDDSKIVVQREMKKNLKTGDKITLGFRPEHLVINKTPNQEIFTKKSVRKGKIMVIEQLGSNLFFYIENKDEPIVVVSPESTTNMQIGDIVNVGFDPHKLHVFDINKNSI